MYLLINMLMIQHNHYFPFTERLNSFHILKTQMHMRNSIPRDSVTNEYTDLSGK